jgi:hypothetical protein
MSDTEFRRILKSQYRAALAMLRDAVEQCPEPLWTAPGHVSAFWQVAYHSVFFTHLYLHREAAAFQPWAGHQRGVQHEDGLTKRADPTSDLRLLPAPYSRADVLAYWQVCADMVDSAVDAMDLDAAECGFSWYNVSKLEHQLINLRHVQHHAAQLADRLRQATDQPARWVGAVPGADR